MSAAPLVTADDIRGRFSRAMSAMYRREVPQYGALAELVRDTNAAVLARHAALRDALAATGELGRVDAERHGAIRLGRADELGTMRRLFAVMGLHPVGTYDLAPAGIPVHATAFRPVEDASLRANPFRVFTSLLRLELVADADLRAEAAAILARRRIFTPGVMALIERFEAAGALTSDEADRFVAEALETFRWHGRASVDRATYERLAAAHRIVADVVCFPGPHINHLTPRTLDIDAAQRAMAERGIAAKDTIEGPPRRAVPILLRQTSFHALAEPVTFAGESAAGAHTARFGEIEQRGAALTREGRALYDRLLAEGDGRAFAAFPDDAAALRRARLGFFRYVSTGVAPLRDPAAMSPDELVDAGVARVVPITYEDFLPVSAAGIFRSNLAGDAPRLDDAGAGRERLHEALGGPPLDEFDLYAAAEARSLAELRTGLS